MTDNEIIKALECCTQQHKCNECPYLMEHHLVCNYHLYKDTLDLINRQQAEIDRLQAECGNQSVLWSKHFEGIFETAKETVKTEAIKEFAEMLKECFENLEYNAKTNRKTVKVEELQEQMDWVLHIVAIKTIDNLLKKWGNKNETY